jgi:hypothetical protein
VASGDTLPSIRADPRGQDTATYEMGQAAWQHRIGRRTSAGAEGHNFNVVVVTSDNVRLAG